MARMYGLFLRDLYPEGRCLAKTRKGTPCKIRGEVFECKNGKLRCRYHGGLSTGPKTRQGKERALKALREGWEKNREQNLKAMRQGLKEWRARKRAEKRERLERERARRERMLRLYAEWRLHRTGS